MPVAEGGNVVILPDGTYIQQHLLPPADVILAPSAARTATFVTPDFTNPGYRGLYVALVVSAASGTGGLTVRFQGKDPASGGYQNLNAAPTAVIATGTTQYVIYPGAAAFAAVTQAVVQALPRTWRFSVNAGDGSSYTYSVGGWLLP
jgi:hypothetical protein